MTTGETISAGMSLLSLAVHAAFDLGLNRDPVQGGHSDYSFREREERRRAFWCLFALSMTITTVRRQRYRPHSAFWTALTVVILS